jgi:hypothetical protein
LFAGDGREEDGLGGFGGLEVVDAGGSGFKVGLSFIGLCLGSLHFLFGQLDELLEDKLWVAYVSKRI